MNGPPSLAKLRTARESYSRASAGIIHAKPAQPIRCHKCQNDLRPVLDRISDPTQPMNFCLFCGADLRPRNAACSGCGYVFFDGLADTSLRAGFCPGCGRSLSETLKGLEHLKQ